jgi:hypothetical protein
MVEASRLDLLSGRCAMDQNEQSGVRWFMNEYTLTFSCGAEPYVEKVFADLDPDAIEMAELAAETLRESDWTKAVLLDNEGAEIWTKSRSGGL